MAKRTVWSLAEARASLERLVGMTESEDWSCLDEYLLKYVADPSQRATVFASSFAAGNGGSNSMACVFSTPSGTVTFAMRLSSSMNWRHSRSCFGPVPVDGS